MNSSLPWAVRRSCVAAHRVQPIGKGRQAEHKANPDPLYAAARAAASRLARLPATVWALDINWRQHAIQLDYAARVQPISRKAGEEKKAHAAIASSLRKAAHYLGRDGQVDPLFAGTLHALSLRWEQRWKPYLAPKTWPTLNADSPRLSDFLDDLAAWIDGGAGASYGMHMHGFERQQDGPNGAAMVAYERVTWLMEELTGQPHPTRVAEIVTAYHPTADDRDRGRTLRARRGKTAKK
ncbi:hypothetical protein [Lysobacter sp. CFH 32150]|uniref:hypothetical protein n=1 Tax=Lysobacter sp. CFH 32150 TaxID=2927128 RepID=UPI001FA75749|nr:hypothetical protein [Lysobacter sp. CFH 32150]MCI4566387.1 hypothetical protein [Lysobacter sp. CFH 32150]